MNVNRRTILLTIFKCFDLLNMTFCLILVGASISHQTLSLSFKFIAETKIGLHTIIFFLISILLWSSVFSYFSLYQSQRLSTRRNEFFRVFQAVSISTLLIFAQGRFLGIKFVTEGFLFEFWMMTSLTSILMRIIMRYILAQIRLRGRNLRYILIIGTNARALAFAKQIQERPELGYTIIGFADEEWDGISDFHETGFSLVSGLRDLPDFLRSHVIDEVVLSLPVKTLYDQAARIVDWCEEQGIIIRYLSNIFEVRTHNLMKNEQIDGYPLTKICNGSTDGWSMMCKRILDCCICMILLPALIPLFIVVAIAIKITSPGPTFFVQHRVGLNKRIFKMYKFRTMVQDAEKRQASIECLNEAGGPVFKIKNDPRITTFGRFLRKTSIDELPQLINVLTGDMSLVGPRPLPVRDYSGFSEDWHRRRFSVRPGLTCLWQVNGRNSIPFDEWMEMDMKYIDQWSLLLDIIILFKTIPAIIRGHGAS